MQHTKLANRLEWIEQHILLKLRFWPRAIIINWIILNDVMHTRSPCTDDCGKTDCRYLEHLYDSRSRTIMFGWKWQLTNTSYASIEMDTIKIMCWIFFGRRYVHVFSRNFQLKPCHTIQLMFAFIHLCSSTNKYWPLV